jgi:hypothetical protein
MMDVKALFDAMLTTLGENLPGILGAIAILIVGWFVAIMVRIIVRRALQFARLNDGIRSTTGKEIDVAGGVAKGAYYLVLLLALIAFFNALQLHLVSSPLQTLVDQVFAYAPKIAAAGVLALVAWVLAMTLRKLAVKGLAATSLDEKMSAEAGMRSISDTLGNVLYWLVILLFLPGILGALGMEGLLSPVQGMTDEALAFVPNIAAAIVIGLVSWFVARLLRDLVGNLLAAAGADTLGRRIGLQEQFGLSKLVGLVVYIFVLVPGLIAALDALQIDAISVPATEMLGTFMAAIPNLFSAAVILVVAYLVSGFVANLVVRLLEGIGFDAIPGKLGVQAALPEAITPSRLVGKLVVFFAMVFATVEAANRLGFTQVAELVATFLEFGGQVLLGAVIITVGFWIANIAHGALQGLSRSGSAPFAGIVKYGIIGLVLAMGLRAMGIADDIVNLAFGLTLGAIAVACALSFGLGGREAAGKQMEHWLSRFRPEK